MINFIFLADQALIQSILFGLVISIAFLFFLLGIYVYSSLALMKIAKRTNTPNTWLAWIPYANFYLISKIAKKHWWPIFLMLISIIIYFLPKNIILDILSYIAVIIFLIFCTIWWWKICERRGRPGWWALIVLIPIIGWIWGLIIIGILAWGKDNNTSSVKIPKPKTY